MAGDATIIARTGVEQMEIEVSDDDSPVMLVRFSFEISRKKQN